MSDTLDHLGQKIVIGCGVVHANPCRNTECHYGEVAEYCVVDVGHQAYWQERLILLEHLRSGTQLSAGYIKDVVDYLFGGRTND